MRKTTVGQTEINHISVADFGDCLGDMVVLEATPMTENKQNIAVKAKEETAPGVVTTLSCGSRCLMFQLDVQVKGNQHLSHDQAYSRVPYGEFAFFAAHAAELTRDNLDELGVAKSVEAPVRLSVLFGLDVASWKTVSNGIASLLGRVTVPIGERTCSR